MDKRELLRQIWVYFLVSFFPAYGFYLINRRLDALQDEQTELHETHDDMIAMFLSRASS